MTADAIGTIDGDVVAGGMFDAPARIEDFHGIVEAVLFARTFADIGHLMGSDRIVLVEGKLDTSREDPSIRVDRIVPIIFFLASPTLST